ncbi:MAG: hypothetical protein PUC32_01295 [Oscillospiraceae bacterium]|nr:hypothetical protein [Oscillospiraceae bacterium]
MTDEMKKNELSEKQLENVAGGKNDWADPGIIEVSSGTTPKIGDSFYAFSIGDRVECNVCFVGTERGTVIDRRANSADGSNLFGPSVMEYWPEYKVRFDKPSYQEKYGTTWLAQFLLCH